MAEADFLVIGATLWAPKRGAEAGFCGSRES